ncbi:MAG TPA: multicopper oxidase domain-containing protein [Rhizomicrobium sp.]|jgi:FtsP/CotA-like multicopper oxidase with cupredoxin domain|nr:multicopper oxidase domain-containing protein [Rhizomicrobium sp.]
MKSMIRGALLALCLGLLAPVQAWANGGVCPRPAVGSEIAPPPDLFSVNGTLETSLNYYTSVDDDGRTLFCFVTTDGKLSPTLHVNPGDRIKIHLTNMVPSAPLGRSEKMSNDTLVCGNADMTDTSVNMHFHGLNVTPGCHGDEVIHTLVNSGETFDYDFKVPADEPPGLYWYHPHVHGISSISVQGGGTGVIEVQGIANIQPAVSGLPERFIVLRDEPNMGNLLGKPNLKPVPNWDVSVNYVTVPFPDYPPAIIKMHAGTQEFWRVANAAANTIMDLRVKYDGVDQPLQIVGYDGVPAGSQDGTRQGVIVTQTGALLPPASRVEFIVNPPSADVKSAILETESIDGGPADDTNPTRPLAQIQLSDAPLGLPHTPKRNGPPNKQRFENLATAKVTAKRLLYFSETPSIIAGPKGKGRAAEPVTFYITVDGQFRVPFNPSNPPAIITNRGAVEEWKIENRSPEVHEFHMHQIHFLVQDVNGVKIPPDQQQFYDTFQVPYYKGKGRRFPYIRVKMDFRGAVVGDFVYHCHILDHEDGGMMAIIRVLPKAP